MDDIIIQCIGSVLLLLGLWCYPKIPHTAAKLSGMGDAIWIGVGIAHAMWPMVALNVVFLCVNAVNWWRTL